MKKRADRTGETSIASSALRAVRSGVCRVRAHGRLPSFGCFPGANRLFLDLEIAPQLPVPNMPLSKANVLPLALGGS